MTGKEIIENSIVEDTGSTRVLGASSLVGYPLDRVRDTLRNIQAKYRIVCKDGSYYLATQDYNPSRYNLYIENEIVIRVEMG